MQVALEVRAPPLGGDFAQAHARKCIRTSSPRGARCGPPAGSPCPPAENNRSTDTPRRRSSARVRCSARRSGTTAGAPRRLWRTRAFFAARRIGRPPGPCSFSRIGGNLSSMSSITRRDVHASRVRPREALQRQAQIVIHAHVRKQARLLRDVPDTPVDQGMRSDAGDVGAVVVDRCPPSDAGIRRWFSSTWTCLRRSGRSTR